MAKPRTKKSTEPTPPAPYVTPAEWLKDSIEFAEKIKQELGLIQWSRDRYSAGEMRDHSFDEAVHDHLENIEHLAIDLVLSLDRASTGANKAEETITATLDELRRMWWRLKQMSA